MSRYAALLVAALLVIVLMILWLRRERMVGYGRAIDAGRYVASGLGGVSSSGGYRKAAAKIGWHSETVA